TVADATGLVVGMPIKGTGIAADSVITAISGLTVTLNQPATTSAATNTLTAGGTTGVLVGMGVSGTGISAGTTVTAVASPLQLTSASTTSASTTVNVANTTGLVVGQPISGPNIPAGATVASITNGTSFVLSAAATATASAQTLTASGFITLSSAATATNSALNLRADRTVTNLLTINGGGLTSDNRSLTGSQTQVSPNSISLSGGTIAAGTLNTVTGVSTAGLVPGMAVFGANVPVGTTVQSVTNSTTFVLSTNGTAGTSLTFGAGGLFLNSATTTASSTAVQLPSVTGLIPGMPVAGPGIALGTTINSVAAPVALTGGATTAASASVTVASTTGLVVGQTVTGAGIPAALTLANAATTSASTTVTVTSTTGLVVGQQIVGTGIPAGATVASINVNGTTFTLSSAATATNTGLTLNANGATIATIPNGTTFTLNLAATATNTAQTFNASGLATLSTAASASAVGQILTAGGQSTAGTLRLASSAASQSFSLGNSNLVLGNGTGAILFTGADAYSINSSALTAVSISATTTNLSNLVTVASTAGLIPGMPITGTGIPANAYITSITDGTKFLISAAATTSATNTLYASGVTGALTGGAAGDLIIHQYGAQALTINAPIANNGASAINLVKNGPGQLTLARLPVSIASGTNASGATTLALANTTGLSVGMYLVGTNIAPNTRITAINSGTGITVDTATTGALTSSTTIAFTDNTYTGNTTVNQGTLSFSNYLQLGAGVNKVVYLRDGSTFQYTGATGDLGAASTANGYKTMSLLGGNVTFDITNAATTLTLNGAIAGAGGMTKIGGGILKFAAAETFTGPLIINAGTILLSAGDRIGDTTPVFIASGAKLDKTAGQDYVGSLAGSGIVDTGSSATTFGVGLANINTTWSGTFTGTGAANFTTRGTSVITMAMPSTSTWTGTQYIDTGTIRIGSSVQQFPTGSTWTIANIQSAVNAGGWLDLNGYSQTIGTLNFYGSASTVNSQAGILLGSGGVLTIG
ncbi:MAG: hypothetical protein EBR83_08020, partial [Verrucomicrobia bacterium]|nr:hypothetical protein [Verrucomicrobiota bacterium]